MQIAGVPINPLNYTGPTVNLVPIKVFTREPLTTDVKYRIGQMVIIGKNPSTGTEGDLWYLSEFDASGDAQWLQLLTGAGSPGVDSITTDDGAPAVQPDGVGNINIVGGAGISVTGNGPGDTVTITSTAVGLTWNIVTGATQAITAFNGYFANRGTGLVQFTLPATASVGDRYIVYAKNANGFQIKQNALQTIQIGNQTTTTGAGGLLQSTAVGDSVEIVCSQANVDFAVTSMMGNLTVT